MELKSHIEKSLESYDRGDRKEALMHACIAIEATARNVFLIPKASNNDYKNCLRNYWWILEAFGCPGINLEETKWTHLSLLGGNGKQILNPDLADIIYHIFRCADAHAQEIPVKYDLLPRKDNNILLGIDFVKKSLQLPESIIFALIAVSVFAAANKQIKSNGTHFLTWEDSKHKKYKFLIKDFWGKENELKAIINRSPPIRVTLEGL